MYDNFLLTPCPLPPYNIVTFSAQPNNAPPKDEVRRSRVSTRDFQLTAGAVLGIMEVPMFNGLGFMEGKP